MSGSRTLEIVWSDSPLNWLSFRLSLRIAAIEPSSSGMGPVGSKRESHEENKRGLQTPRRIDGMRFWTRPAMVCATTGAAGPIKNRSIDVVQSTVQLMGNVQLNVSTMKEKLHSEQEYVTGGATIPARAVSEYLEHTRCLSYRNTNVEVVIESVGGCPRLALLHWRSVRCYFAQERSVNRRGIANGRMLVDACTWKRHSPLSLFPMRYSFSRATMLPSSAGICPKCSRK